MSTKDTKDFKKIISKVHKIHLHNRNGDASFGHVLFRNKKKNL